MYFNSCFVSMVQRNNNKHALFPFLILSKALNSKLTFKKIINTKSSENGIQSLVKILSTYQIMKINFSSSFSYPAASH